ncbi:toll/interleukin-1 receptor domain-containing protein [uncultured Methanobrevibacter sp.]|uniref:toll/interleukin-1 receptor domain-containing protein n=1 Tax=uncultured Methanobrevibacter sp. TaxID=253161 RepID=UPI0025E13535|nr:toll/interleukin-1 receptor domain-containing protein [uncultured Methanobrevibacter sp.]
MNKDIFISYSSSDQEIAEGICSHFEKNGLSCWIAPRNVRPGENYAEEIMLGLENAKIVVLVFSKNSQSSKYVTKEIQKAYINNKEILPVNIDDSLPKDKMKTFLRNKQWLNAFPNPEDSYDVMVMGARRLIEGKRPDRGFVPMHSDEEKGGFFDNHKYHVIAIVAIILIAVVGFVAFNGTSMNSNGTNSSQSLVSIDYIQMDDDTGKGYSWKYSYFVFGSISSNVSDSSNIVHIDFLDESGKVVMSNETKVGDINDNTLGIYYGDKNTASKVSLEVRDSSGKVLANAESNNFVVQ